MADKKKIGDDLMADLKKAFSTKNDILQYLMKTVPGPKLKKQISSKSKPSEFQILSAELKASTKKPAKKSSAKQYRPSKGTQAKNFNVGVSKGGVSFKEAFAHFRKKGSKTFTWNGKKYTTKLKSEK
jgi:hypothetical protein